MTQMLICRLTHCPGHDKTTVVLEDVDRRLELAFVIPVNEAYRLAQVLGLARCTCVPVLELIDGLLAHCNARVLRAVLDGDEGEVSATLYVGENDGEAAFPCHPADALALAERIRAPIYATDEILHHARQLGQPPGCGTGHADGAYDPARRGQKTFILNSPRSSPPQGVCDKERRRQIHQGRPVIPPRRELATPVVPGQSSQ
jgi:bifunctional DNase/RNase